MTTFTDDEVATHVSAVLDRACVEGEVRIRRPDGSEFVLRPSPKSPMDVGYITPRHPITTADIVAAIHEGRERG